MVIRHYTNFEEKKSISTTIIAVRSLTFFNPTAKLFAWAKALDFLVLTLSQILNSDYHQRNHSNFPVSEKLLCIPSVSEFDYSLKIRARRKPSSNAETPY